MTNAPITILTLGCRVNQAESAELARGLARLGFSVTEKLCKGNHGGIYLINTCAITQMAERKSRHLLQTIMRGDPTARIIIMGCASENDAKQFKSPNILKVFGTDKGAVLDFVKSLKPPKGQKVHQRQTKSYYLKVQDGCNNQCAYCIVPRLRGRSRSRALDEILAEAKTAQADEIMITGINLAQYDCLATLCVKINELGKPFRISSLYLEVLTDDFINTLKTCNNLIPSFHLSLQTCSDSVLKSMGRRYSVKDIKTAVARLRSVFADAVISADIIVGFPTETEEDFAQTKEVLQGLRLDHLHVFPYSPRPGTEAAKMQQIQSSTITRRAGELMVYNILNDST